MKQPNVNCCDKNVTPWRDGKRILKNIDDHPISGTTGVIKFNKFGQRENFHFQVDKFQCEMRECRFEKIATWDGDQVILTRNMSEIKDEIHESLSTKMFTVVTLEGMPYLRRTNATNPADPNDQYEGFSKDLLDEIAKRLNLTYKFVLAKDKLHGSKNNETQKWNGMIREVSDQVSSSNWF